MALVRLITIMLLFISSAFGAEVSKVSTETEEAPSKNYSIAFGSVLESSLHKTDDVDHALSNEISISPSYTFLNGVKLTTAISGVKDLKGERKFTLGNGAIALSTTLRTYDKLTIVGATSLTIPLKESTKKIQKLRTSVKLSPVFVYAASDNISLSYNPAVRVNFHEYKTSLEGKSNTQYSLSNKASASYNVMDLFSIGIEGLYARSFTYRGNTKDAYSFSQSISFAPTEATGIELGHSIGGNPLSANGIDNEIEIFNSRDSSVYAGFSFTY